MQGSIVQNGILTNWRSEITGSGHVHMMAVTATAVISTRRKVIASLNMVDVHVDSQNSHKNNITYIVKEKSADIADILSPIVDDVFENNRNASWVIMFPQLC